VLEIGGDNMSKGIKIKTVKDKIPDMIKTFESLNGKKVQVGVFDGENAWLARIHEYGCDIRAKKAQYLTIPISPKSIGKKAGEFDDLFFVQAKSGEKFLARDGRKSEVELLYWLTKSVKIPERSFLRAGFDENVDKLNKTIDRMINSLLNGNISEDEFCNIIGQTLSSKIKTFARNLNSPANSRVTKENKGSSNPLVDTGQMIRGITWKVDD
jgi:hypothetical protein